MNNQAQDIINTFKYIKNHQQEIEIDAIKKLIEPFMINYIPEKCIIPAGQYIYRARKISDNFKKSQNIKLENLKHPSPELAKLGRANRKGHPMFYASLAKEPIFFEVKNLNPGDELIIGFWRTTADMEINNIGLTRWKLGRMNLGLNSLPYLVELTDAFGYSLKVSLNVNPMLGRRADYILSKDTNYILNQLISDFFMCFVDGDENYKYNLTAALTELHLNKENAGVIYPSIRAIGAGDNIALLPKFVDEHIIFKKAIHIRIDNVNNNTLSITNIDTSKSLSNEGKLEWLGRMPKWKIPPGKRVKVELAHGLDSYGDYGFNKDKNICHWKMTDENNCIIEAM
jgi:hypothetical protein